MCVAKCLTLRVLCSQVCACVPKNCVDVTIHVVSFAWGTCAGDSKCVALCFMVCMTVASVCVCVCLCRLCMADADCMGLHF